MRANPVSKKKFSVRAGDMVMVIAGGSKSKRGKVLRVLKDKDRVLVEGLNKVKRHVKPTQANPQGGIVEKEASIHISNVMVIDPKTDKPTRVGKKQENGKWVRVARKSGTVIVAAQAKSAAAAKTADKEPKTKAKSKAKAKA